MINQEPTRFERYKKTGQKAAKAFGGVALVLASLVGCDERIEPEVPDVERIGAAPDCQFNGRKGDPDPSHLTVGETVSVFPGTVEYGITDFYPVIELGKKGVSAAWELVHDTEANGFRFAPIPQSSLKQATWQLDASVARPGDTETDLVSKDDCKVGSIVPDRKTIPMVYRTLQETAITPLDKTPAPHGLKLTVAINTLRDNPTVEMPFEDWRKDGAFGMGLSNVHAKELNANGRPEILEIKVPIG